MELSGIAGIALRVLLLIFAVVVLGLSVTVNKWWDSLAPLCNSDNDCDTGAFNAIHVAFQYCIFVGVWGILDAFFGIAATFVEAIPWFIVAAVEALTAIFFVAGGGRLASLIGNASCNDATAYQSECNDLKADTAFLFLGFVAALALIGLSALSLRNR